MTQWDKEHEYERIFGDGGHVDSARAQIIEAKKAAGECRLLGEKGVLYLLKHFYIQLNAARQINSRALGDELFSQPETEDNHKRIYDTEQGLIAELNSAIEQGCPCAKKV